MPLQFAVVTFFGRHEHCQCAIVELAQVCRDRFLEKSDTVELAVAVEIGMESGGNRKLEFGRRSKLPTIQAGPP